MPGVRRRSVSVLEERRHQLADAHVDDGRDHLRIRDPPGQVVGDERAAGHHDALGIERLSTPQVADQPDVGDRRPGKRIVQEQDGRRTRTLGRPPRMPPGRRGDRRTRFDVPPGGSVTDDPLVHEESALRHLDGYRSEPTIGNERIGAELEAFAGPDLVGAPHAPTRLVDDGDQALNRRLRRVRQGHHPVVHSRHPGRRALAGPDICCQDG